MSHISANEEDVIGKTRESLILIAEANMRQLRFVNCSEETFLAINMGQRKLLRQCSSGNFSFEVRSRIDEIRSF